MTADPAPGPHRAALRRRVAERVAGMEAEAAARWIAGHGLLAAAGWPEISGATRSRLKERVAYTAAYNLLAIERFREIVDVLETVPVCPLKGLYLLDTIYRTDPGARPLADLDLLLPEERLDEAVRRLGETLSLEELPTSRRLRWFFYERLLAGRSVQVDLHARLGYKHGAASSWRRVAPEPATVHDRAVFALDPETTLVHLVVHLIKHRPLSRLGWVEDVLRWTERGLDEVCVEAVARRLGALRSFLAGVRILRRVVGDDFLPGLGRSPDGQPLGIERHERWLWNDLATGALPDPSSGDSFGARFGAVLSAVVLADRPRHAVHAVVVKLAEVAFRRGVPRPTEPPLPVRKESSGR